MKMGILAKRYESGKVSNMSVNLMFDVNFVCLPVLDGVPYILLKLLSSKSMLEGGSKLTFLNLYISMLFDIGDLEGAEELLFEIMCLDKFLKRLTRMS